jgi:N-acetylmuramoyl-L-alanine amidase
LQAIDRLGERCDSAEAVARVVERETLRRGPRTLQGRRVAVVDAGGAGALAAAFGRLLGRAGASLFLIQHPDGSEQAAQANAAEVDVVLTLSLRPDLDGCASAYYTGFSGESVGGRALAELLQDRLPGVLGIPALGARGMSLPVLRETGMPAVVCELGPPTRIVEGGAEVAEVLAAVLSEWSASSWD